MKGPTKGMWRHGRARRLKLFKLDLSGGKSTSTLCVKKLRARFRRRARTSPVEPRWLPVEEVIFTNQFEVSATNEPFGILSEALLESACARPENLYAYDDVTDIVRLAVALIAGIARNHCFEQGNKRTAATAGILFLRINGYVWTAPNTITFGQWIEAMVKRQMTEDELAERMRPYVEPSE